jgi:hypothetical protein
MAGEDQYSQDLRDTKEKLELLLKWREDVEIVIARAKRKIALLTELSKETESDRSGDLGLGGLQESCATVLRGSTEEWLTIAEIESGLRELGFPVDQYKAPRASITTTVNRLVKTKRVVVNRQRTLGITQYKWRNTMTKWINVRPLTDKYSGASFHLSVTGDTSGAAPGCVIENHDELAAIFGRAGIEKLIPAVDEAHSKREVFCSGPLDMTHDQEDILLGRR